MIIAGPQNSHVVVRVSRTDVGEAPLGELIVGRLQRPRRRLFNASRTKSPAQPETAHDVAVHARERDRDAVIGLVKREVRLWHKRPRMHVVQSEFPLQLRLIAWLSIQTSL